MHESLESEELLANNQYTGDTMISPIKNSNLEKFLQVKTSNWRYEGCCCCQKKMVIDELNRSYCMYWEIAPFMPILAMFLIFFAFSSYIFITFPRLQLHLKIISGTEVTVILFLFVWSYFAAMLFDPGYLPFNWIETQRAKYKPEEIVEGTITNELQYNFAKENMPPSCSLSKTTGRFIIRADHICGWITNWIGKRNHKQFILMNFYGAIYSMSLFFWRFMMNDVPDQSKEPIIVFWMIGSGAIELIYTLVLFWSFALNMIDLLDNATTITRHKQIQMPQLSTVDAMREICGGDNYLLWCCPTAAFGDHIQL